jgi:hypothetical protein
MLAILDVTPLMIVVKRLAEDVAMFVLIKLKVVVAKIPLVVLLSIIALDDDELVRVLVVIEVNPERDVVDITPLIVVVNILVEVANDEELPVMMVEVATTPLTVEVRMLPVAD